MIKYIYITLLLLPNIAIPKLHGYSPNPIIKAVYKLKPSINHIEAKTIAKAIGQCYNSTRTDWRTLLSITYIESHLDRKAVRKNNGKITDYGIAQINWINVKQYHLNKHKLFDIEYNIKAACNIITDIKKIKHNCI